MGGEKPQLHVCQDFTGVFLQSRSGSAQSGAPPPPNPPTAPPPLLNSHSELHRRSPPPRPPPLCFFVAKLQTIQLFYISEYLCALTWLKSLNRNAQWWRSGSPRWPTQKLCKAKTEKESERRTTKGEKLFGTLYFAAAVVLLLLCHSVIHILLQFFFYIYIYMNISP